MFREPRVPGPEARALPIRHPEPRFPILCAIIDVEAAERARWHPIEVARACLKGGARFLQVRAKTKSAAALLDVASEVVRLARPSGALVVVNDRADVAKLAGAGGVHLGQEDLAPAAARSMLDLPAIPGGRAETSRGIIGKSTHSDDQLAAAAREPIDYLAIGPVFHTGTKATGYQAVGLEMVQRATGAGLPVVAIGGITVENARTVVDAGASSVAVISDLLAKGDPEARVRAFLARLGPRASPK
jgi:thiamine-phosphate pyrophosphorylase